MRCESCLLTSEEGAALPLDAFLERLELCDECPTEHGEAPLDLVPLKRLLGRQREAARATRKLGNKLRKAERQVEELRDGLRGYEERAALLEDVQKACVVQSNEELEAKMALVRQKEEAIAALSTPIIEVWDGVLVLPVIGALDDQRAGGILAALLESVAKKRAQRAILEMTGVDRIDAGTADYVAMISRAVRMLGAQVILSGIRPEVVSVLVELRVDLAGVATERSLKEALRRCGVGDGKRRTRPI